VREHYQHENRIRVEFTAEADADLDRFLDFLLEPAETVEGAMRACEAVEVIRTVANSRLSTTPYSYRKVGARPTLRELIAPFGSTRYVLRFDIRTPKMVLVLGARHQREEDYH
jgi:plasmid stabilization system protein ParE